MNDLITDDVFEIFPECVRAVVIATNLTIEAENPRIAAYLKEAQAHFPLIENDEQIEIWDQAHIRFGSNPKRFPPSLRSLVERVRRGKPLPLINSAVGIMNAISLKYRLPVGGDDLHTISGDLCLGLATGNERFIPLGSDQTEFPVLNEVIYWDTGDKKVMCRRWNWRNGDETKITPNTQSMVINIDGLSLASQEIIQQAAQEIAAWLQSECNATVQCDILHTNRRSIVI